MARRRIWEKSATGSRSWATRLSKRRSPKTGNRGSSCSTSGTTSPMNEASKRPKFTVAEIAKQLGGVVAGDASIIITGFSSTDTARPGDLTFAENEIYFERAEKSAASAVLV